MRSPWLIKPGAVTSMTPRPTDQNFKVALRFELAEDDPLLRQSQPACRSANWPFGLPVTQRARVPQRPAARSLPVRADRTDLDAATQAGRWNASRKLHCVLDVVGLEQQGSADSSGGVDIRPIRDAACAVLDSNRGRVLRHSKWRPGRNSAHGEDGGVLCADFLLLLA